ncbi:MAG: hypothetical protein Ct9H90mP27_4060 [Gammaproteobacteria bacterium]|nr:MAG: hypothetical protein Ct9H90mP27_4060 [Gammaproteobacteria bacterium]
MDGLNAERILIAAEAFGIGRAAMAKAVAYANERVVLVVRLGKTRVLRFR